MEPVTPIAGLVRTTPPDAPLDAGDAQGDVQVAPPEEDASDDLSSDLDDAFAQRGFERGITCDVPSRGFERGITVDMPFRGKFNEEDEDHGMIGKQTSCPLTREHRLAGIRRPMTLDDILSPAVGCRAEQEVMQLLERPGDVSTRRRAANASTPAASARYSEDHLDFCLDRAIPRPAREGLRLKGGMHAIPHPEKASCGGADSHFLDRCGRGVGIADGVGEWEWRFGVNARAFADELMAGCEDALQKSSDFTDGETTLQVKDRAMRILQHGMGGTRSFGSSTALVATLDRSGMLGIANLGDSALMVLRYEAEPLVGGWRCIARTREQQHAFNCPYQLSLMPEPSDFPELMRQGKERLVRAIERAPPHAKVDRPEDADLYTLQMQEGDLVVLGTDGVFDNLYMQEVCELASHATSPFEAKLLGAGQPTDPAKVAAAIAKAAFHRSMDREARTPFGDHARQAGLYHTGGKMDDITCVCAWLVLEE